MSVTSNRQMSSKANELLLNQAARWYARLRAPDCSAANRHLFQQWLEQDPGHAQAYQAAERTAERIAQQIQFDSRLRALTAAALAKPAAANPQPSSMKKFGTVLRTHWRSAAMALFGAGVAVLFAGHVSEKNADFGPMVSYANDEMHEQRIELSDGSILHLDAGTQINVVMSSTARRLELSKGRAYFEVAHDESRPFSVVAGGTRTVALGTRFEVSLLSQTVNVTLAEGSVAITDTTSGRWREVLTPGQQLQVHTHNDRRDRLEINANTIASWSQGRLIFDGMPLANVLDEINRYAEIKIHLGDSKLANIPIGGNFMAGGDSNEFVETLTAVLPLRSVRAGANEIVLFQRYESYSP